MSSILRPPAEAFRRAGWIAANQTTLLNYIQNLMKKAKKRGEGRETLLPEVRAFRKFIEEDPVVLTDFIRMFEGATEIPTNYVDLVYCLDEIFRQAPSFGSLGPPVYMIMAQSMNTQGGFSAYTKENLNYHFKKLFVAWAQFLTSKDSRYVIEDKEGGWLSSAAKDKMMDGYPDRTFEEVFICDPRAPYYGYTSFEDFFNRRYANPSWDRPTGPIGNLAIISAACESTVYAYQTKVQRYDELFIKDEKYSLVHLLANDPYTDEFVGGIVLQGFLNTTGYHRWHAPVNGTIKKIVNVPGTYFAQAPNTLNTPIPPPESKDPPPYLKSLRFFANTAARQLIFIDSDNHALGLVCFIAIGMTEISSCEATVNEGQHVARGDELGMFHFGGSSSALVFRAAANVQVDPEFQVPGNALRINEPIAVVGTRA